MPQTLRDQFLTPGISSNQKQIHRDAARFAANTPQRWQERWRFVFRLLAVLSEFERDLASERTKAALALRKALRVRLAVARRVAAEHRQQQENHNPGDSNTIMALGHVDASISRSDLNRTTRFGVRSSSE
jgi:hypothetical protein